MDKKQTSKKYYIIMTIVIVCLAILGGIFTTVCFPYLTDVLYKYRSLIVILLAVILAVLTILSLVFLWVKKETAYKLCLTIFILLDFCLISFYFLISTGFLSHISSQQAFEEYLRSTGAWMPILFCVLQYLQVVILPIPSFITIAAGTVLFGVWMNFLYSFIAIVLGSLTAFIIGRYLGVKAANWLVGEENLKKWMAKIKGKDVLILSMMFLLPLFPDDLLCFVAGISCMTFPYFVVMIIICRAIAILGTCFSIDLIPFNTWWGILTWICIWIVFGLIFIWLFKNTDKIQAWWQSVKKKLKIKKKSKKNKDMKEKE